MGKIRKFETGATRDTEEDKLDYEGFLSPLVLQCYEQNAWQWKNIAWAAGLFEGEGCVTICKNKGRKRKDGTYSKPGGYNYPRLSMSLTDEEIIRKFQDTIGGTVGGPTIRLNRKSVWWWSVQGDHAFAAGFLMFPYLGLRRQAKLKELFGESICRGSTGSLLEPQVLESFSNYMHRHRKQSDGNLRASDNWQKGIPKDAYMKSAWRHFMDWWLEHRGFRSREGIEAALVGLLFNAMGYLFEILKQKEEYEQDTKGESK